MAIKALPPSKKVFSLMARPLTPPLIILWPLVEDLLLRLPQPNKGLYLFRNKFTRHALLGTIQELSLFIYIFRFLCNMEGQRRGGRIYPRNKTNHIDEIVFNHRKLLTGFSCVIRNRIGAVLGKFHLREVIAPPPPPNLPTKGNKNEKKSSKYVSFWPIPPP